MTVFDEATAVRRIGDGRYEARPDPRFAIVVPGAQTPPAVNGGVLIATMLRAVLDSSPLPHPVAASTHFLRVAKLEPAEIQVTWLKAGRIAATARATLIQHGEAVLEATVTTGTVPASAPASVPASAADRPDGDGAGFAWTGAPPALPPPEQCVDLGAWPGSVAPDGTQGYARQVRALLDPAVTGWRIGMPAGTPEMRGYFGLREDRDPDPLLLALAVDGLPPVVFGLGASGWAPTVELTMRMRMVPAPGLLRVAARCRHVSGGWFDEEAEVWDAAGNLVAQSSQIARLGRGPAERPADRAAVRERS